MKKKREELNGVGGEEREGFVELDVTFSFIFLVYQDEILQS